MKYLHTMVRVTDLEQSLHFYRDLLGLEETRRIDGLNRSERLIDPSWAPNWGERPRVEA